jgi:hypothetical protein
MTGWARNSTAWLYHAIKNNTFWSYHAKKKLDLLTISHYKSPTFTKYYYYKLRQLLCCT